MSRTPGATSVVASDKGTNDNNNHNSNNNTKKEDVVRKGGSAMALGIKCFFPRSKYRIVAAPSAPFGKKSLSPSNSIIGHFQKLKGIRHPRLCQYLDIIKGKHDRIFVMSEHFDGTLHDMLLAQSGKIIPEAILRKYVFQILEGLSYLNKEGIVHRNLHLQNILVDSEGNVKLADYGLYWMTEAGALVPFPIGEPSHQAPEAIAAGVVFSQDDGMTPKADVWSLGVILMELLTGRSPWATQRHQQQHHQAGPAASFQTLLEILAFAGHDIHMDLQINKIKDLEKSDIESLRHRENGIGVRGAKNSGGQSVVHRASTTASRDKRHADLAANQRAKLDEWFKQPELDSVSSELKDFITQCFVADPERRADPTELFHHPYLSDLHEEQAAKQLWVPKPFVRINLLSRGTDDPWKCKLLDSKVASTSTPQYVAQRGGDDASRPPQQEKPTATVHEHDLSLPELFQFWKAATGGGNIEGALAPQLRISPAIQRLPVVMRAQTAAESDIRLLLQQHGQKDESRRYDPSIIIVPMATLKESLKQQSSNLASPDLMDDSMWTVEQKERDIEYQRKRVRLFRELLANYPETRPQIIQEAKKDIPPVLRGALWGALLNIPTQEECKKAYDSIDKESEGPADKQIELDIPRCHQYHELLSSPEGHRKFKNILKAWVANNPRLSYWQGIDSLLAPFLSLNFDNEPRAFFCLQRIIEKYSKNLFGKENSVFLQEHLHTFKQLLSYHDPKLSTHLHELGFQPDLYAIPWFLTLFTHDFSLEQIYRLWDKVLTSNSQLPFYLSYAIMKQLREVLLPLDFNSCILLFSSLPSINIDEFIRTAKTTFKHTPPSITRPNFVHEEYGHAADRWWEVRVLLDDLQGELFPRLSVMDLIGTKFHFVVIDIRAHDEFALLSYPGAVHFNPATDALDRLDAFRGKHLVVVTDKDGVRQGIAFANSLVEAWFPRVSLLNGGIDALLADAGPVLKAKQFPSTSTSTAPATNHPSM